MFANIKNIVNAIGAIRGLLGLIQPITDLIHQVEVSGVSGAEKKAGALSLISSTIRTVESAFNIALPDELILCFAGNIIDVIVSVENMLGRLPHSSPAAPAPAVAAGPSPLASRAMPTAASAATGYRPEGPG